MWIDGINNYLLDACFNNPNVDVDKVPPLYQYGSINYFSDLPEDCIYYVECHLNWHVVYIVNESTMEIVGIHKAIKCYLIEISVAQRCDGNSTRTQCKPDNYQTFNVLSLTFTKLLKGKEEYRTHYL